MMVNDVMLTCKRSKTMIWKKEDIERSFEITEDKTDKDVIKISKTNFDKYSLFVIKPRSRFDSSGEVKLGNRNDLIYFEIDGIETNDMYTKFVFCGYAIATTKFLKHLSPKEPTHE